MIVFDLKCAQAHVFEGWFGSTDDYEGQRDRRLLACPLCGDARIEKAVMAPNVGTKGNRASKGEMVSVAHSTGSPADTPAAMKAMLEQMAKLRAKLLDSSEWVGTGFADQARAMHHGERDTRSIHGQTSLAEAQALVDEGIEVAQLPLPIVPPDASN